MKEKEAYDKVAALFNGVCGVRTYRYGYLFHPVEGDHKYFVSQSGGSAMIRKDCPASIRDIASSVDDSRVDAPEGVTVLRYV